MRILHAIEIVETKEVKKLSPSKLATLLTTREQAYCAWHKRRKEEHLAARIAAKQALRKIVPQANWLEIEIRKEENGRPLFAFTGKTATLLKKKKIKKIHLSLSHTSNDAIASLICY